MKTRHDLITNFLFEVNGQFDEHLYEKLEEFSRYAINRYKVYIVVAAMAGFAIGFFVMGLIAQLMMDNILKCLAA